MRFLTLPFPACWRLTARQILGSAHHVFLVTQKGLKQDEPCVDYLVNQRSKWLKRQVSWQSH